MPMTSNLAVVDPSAHPSFPDGSTLDLLVPDASDFDLDSHLESETPLESRHLVLFEETLPVYIVLRTSLPSFENLLRDLEITVSAHATPASPPPRLQQDGQSAPPEKPLKLTLDSITLTNRDSPIFSSFSTETSHVAWKTQVQLRYPAQKLHRPSVHLTASAVLKSSGAPVPLLDHVHNEYLTSAVPTSENLFQSLQYRTYLPENQPCLPSSRIQKVAPRASPTFQEARPLRISSRLFPVFPALAVIVHITPENLPDMLLSLDLESSRHTDYGGVQVNQIKADGENVLIEPFSSDPAAMESPVTLYTGDRSTFLYKLTQEHDSASPPTKPNSVHFEIRAVAQLSPTCRVQIQSQWRGNVHFSQPQPSQRSSRQSIRPQSVSQDSVLQRPMSKHMSYTGRPSYTARPMSSMTNTDFGGVMFAFTGPESVLEGETFNLDVFVVNRGLRKKRLAIVAIPKPARVVSSVAGPQRTSMIPNIPRQDSTHVAEAVLDNRTIYNLQGQKETRIAEVVGLNADVRVGPLPPGACHNVQLEFLTLSPGLVGLSAVHVVDLDTRETTHITDLPDIIVSKAANQ